MNEIMEKGTDMYYKPSKVHCTAFEDNRGVMELERVPRICPQTKRLNNYYHHFRFYTEGQDPQITIPSISTEEQIGDMFTKPLLEKLFIKFRKSLMGW